MASCAYIITFYKWETLKNNLFPTFFLFELVDNDDIGFSSLLPD